MEADRKSSFIYKAPPPREPPGAPPRLADVPEADVPEEEEGPGWGHRMLPAEHGVPPMQDLFLEQADLGHANQLGAALMRSGGDAIAPRLMQWGGRAEAAE